ncbi:MAG: acyltransferase family protein [Muribaculaceae bacterium]|nr:acyltransferase family protein [Muribaculaceae bacterium]
MSKREHYIDALRGLTMLSVVIVHLLVRGFGLDPNVSGLAVIRATFTLPLFFCVSGYFAYRPVTDFTLTRVRNSLKTRICALLFGTIVFDTLYLITLRRPNPFIWSDGDFDSYWYTFTLLQIYILYLITVLITRLTTRSVGFSLRINLTLLTLCAISGYIAHYYIDYTTYRYYWIFAPKSMEYLQFFLVGTLVRANSRRFFALLERPRLLTVLIIAYVASIVAHYYYGTSLRDINIWVYRINNDIISRYTALLLVLYIFYNVRTYFERQTPLVRAWCRVGTRTLDIYYLHYFLIPTMRWMKPWLTSTAPYYGSNTILLQLLAALPLALIIIVLCMAIGSLIRRAPLLRLLLGQK